MKTCVEGIKHGTRIGRSWGAGLKYDEVHLNYGGPTKADFDMKPSVDVTGNLSITKIANAATVINPFVAKYVGDLKWDYLLIGRECEISRWGPITWGFDDIQDFTEGICGMIRLGTASDCIGRINGRSYQQGIEGEVVCFTGVGKDANHHFDIRSHEHDYELQPVGSIILLGRKCPTLPCTDDGNDIIEAVRFKFNSESSNESTTTLQPAFPASKHVKCDDEEFHNRVMIEGCTNPGSLLSEKTPWSKGCKVIPTDKNDDWRSSGTLDKCRDIFPANDRHFGSLVPALGGLPGPM